VPNPTDWMLSQISKTETMAGLNYLAEVIKMDADHGAEYALEPLVVGLRKAWGERKKMIEKGLIDVSANSETW